MTHPIQATTPVEVLERAIILLSKEDAWTKGTMAKNPIGHNVQPYDQSASCFCTLGALERAARGIIQPEDIGAFYAKEDAMNAEVAAANFVSDVLFGRRGVYSIPGFNDAWDTTHEEVISVLHQALADARVAAAV